MTTSSKPGLLRNLQIGFGLSLLILVITSVASFSSIQNLLDGSKWVDHTDSVVNQLSSALTALQDAETGERGYLLSNDTSFLRPFYGARERSLAIIDRVQSMTVDNPVQQANIAELRPLLAERLAIVDTILDQKRSNNIFSLEDLRRGKGYMDEARLVIGRMQEEEHRLLVMRLARVQKFSTYTPVLIVVAAFLSILITLFFYRKVYQDFQERTGLYSALQEKDLEISQRIDIIREIADKVSEGNYQIRVSDEEKDSLGNLSGALNKMAESLEYSFNLLSDKEWLQTGVAELSKIMVGETDLGSLVQNTLSHITQYSHSLTGAFYTLDAPAGILTLQGGYALHPDTTRKSLRLGEGLAGQVARSGKPQLLKDIHTEEWNFSLAAGEIRPRAVVAFPLLHEGRVKGVIEVCTVESWTPRDLEFFTGAGTSVGAAAYSIETRLRLQELLEETQAQTEELQAQHSEMENLNMELEMQAEKLQVSEEELKVQQEELQQINQELEERSRSLEEKNHLVLLRNLDIQKKAEELALSSKYKSEFMANMSHELRTPLNSILLLSRLLSENTSENLNAEQVEYARVIRNSGQGLLELIDEILDLSRIESGKLQLEPSLIFVSDIVEDMRMLFEPLAKDRNLELKLIVEGGTPEQLETDKTRLEQILKNLLSNAFKFTPKGSITLRIAPSSVQKGSIAFSVKDTGIGIPEDKHQLVFEAFQQADGSTRRQYGGTGLGLSISRELVRLLGGEISLTSAPGEGSEFVVFIPQFKTLPTASSSSSPKEPSVAEAAATTVTGPSPFTLSDIPPDIPDDRHEVTATDRILLIVEDDAFFARALLEFGRKKGYKGIVAVRGDIALSLARVYKPAGILLDIQLPLRNGWEVMDDLKKDPQTRHIPVHIISSFEVKEESLLKGAIDFIAKPNAFENIDSIFEKIEYVISRSPKKVLIVEDNTRHAEALSYFLSTHAIHSEIVQDVEGSIAALQKEDPECVILSRNIAEGIDYEVLDTVRREEGLGNIPIIVFTGKAISRGEEVRLRQFADSIVVKTAHSYQRILDEVSLFLHRVDEVQHANIPGAPRGLGVLDEILKNKVVLVADDDVRNIFALTKALENHKMKVLSAMDGKEALAAMENAAQPVDIILMDMMMPEMDGYEAITRLRKDPRLRKLPIIAVTAKAMAGDREKCIQAGASDYISKPVDIDQLLSLLRIWLYEK